MAEIEVPKGFEEVTQLQGGFNNAFRPFYVKASEEGYTMGFVVLEKHSNSMGICHGGALMTFCDMALALAVLYRYQLSGSAPTMNLSFDFMASAKLGDVPLAETGFRINRIAFGPCVGQAHAG